MHILPGIFPRQQYYWLEITEGQTLAGFLDNGGNLYMEGGDTWAYDTPTPVHPYFKINGISDGSGDLVTIAGQLGSIAEGMSYTYAGENSYIDRLNPLSGAVTVFRNQSPSYGCAISYDGGSYKTIGASFEFGGLVNGAFTRRELMEKYLYFFGFTGVPEAPQMPSGATEVCGSDQNVEYSTGSVEGADYYVWIIEPQEAGNVSGMDHYSD